MCHSDRRLRSVALLRRRPDHAPRHRRDGRDARAIVELAVTVDELAALTPTSTGPSPRCSARRSTPWPRPPIPPTPPPRVLPRRCGPPASRCRTRPLPARPRPPLHRARLPPPRGDRPDRPHARLDHRRPHHGAQHRRAVHAPPRREDRPSLGPRPTDSRSLPVAVSRREHLRHPAPTRHQRRPGTPASTDRARSRPSGRRRRGGDRRTGVPADPDPPTPPVDDPRGPHGSRHRCRTSRSPPRRTDRRRSHVAATRGGGPRAPRSVGAPERVSGSNLAGTRTSSPA